MKNDLLPFDRRMEMLFLLVRDRKKTRRELAEKFSVSDDAVDRDIVVLSRYVPITIKRGRNGGIYLSEDYNGIKTYLNDEEETLIREYMNNEKGERKRILDRIIHKFAMPQNKTIS